MAKMAVQARLDRNSMPIPECGCRVWLGSVRGASYGGINVNGKMAAAHRVAWEVANGPIPDGLDILHKCDVSFCINPLHLVPGTHADNMQDMARKHRNGGFTGKGEKNGRAKLSEADVLAIRASERSCADLGRSFGVRPTLISQIKLRQIWRHL